MKNLNIGQLHESRFPLPLVMIHGSCGNGCEFERMAQYAVEQGFRSKIITLRHHKRQLKVDIKDLGKTSVLDYVEDVRREVENIGQCVLIGHSMGGLIAQKVAEDNENVKGLVLIASAAPKGIPFLSPPVLWRIPRYLPSFLFNKRWRFIPKHAREIVFNATDPMVADWFIDKFVYESGRAGRECAFGLIPVNAERVTAKTLVVGAGLDLMAPLYVQEQIARYYGARLEYVSNSDHMLHANEEWKICSDIIFQWIKKNLHEEVAIV